MAEEKSAVKTPQGSPLSMGDVEMAIAQQEAAKSPVRTEQRPQASSLATKQRCTVTFTGVNKVIQLAAPTSAVQNVVRSLGGAAEHAHDSAGMSKQILFDISGVFRPSTITAIMGPSGSGKTTLLNAIGGRGHVGLSGEIRFNGQLFDKSMRRSIAMAQQEDIFFMHLSVRDQLNFTALLRLPQSLTQAERKRQVDDVIETLNIEKCADTPIMLVSGGEKKRTNIGTELLTNPSVMLLDEPTSGLDSTSAVALMQTLRKLAETGRTIVTSIHQPSSLVFYMFDNLMLLADGHMVYDGAPRQCMPYLATLGYTPPGDYNPADFVMDLLNSADLNAVPDSAKKDERAGAGDESSRPPRQVLIEAWDNGAAEQRAAAAVAELSRGKDVVGFGEASRGRPTSYLWQLRVLLVRSALNSRSKLFTTLNFVQSIGLALISGVAWFQLENDEDNISDRNGFVFFFLAVWFFQALFAGMMEFPAERVVLLKERSAGSYYLSAYFLSKTLSEMPLRVLLPGVYLFISYWMADLQPRFGSFVGIMGTNLMGTLCGESIGLFIGTTTMDMEKAMVIATLVSLSMMVLGGFFVELEPWLEWLVFLSPFKCAYHASLLLVFPEDYNVDCNNGNFLPRCVTEDSVDGQYITSFLDVTLSLGANVGMLVGYTVVYRLGAYFALRFLNHNQ